jgi:hypothetical protein
MSSGSNKTINATANLAIASLDPNFAFNINLGLNLSK